MLRDRGDKCRRVNVSNPKIEDVGAGFELSIIEGFTHQLCGPMGCT